MGDARVRARPPCGAGPQQPGPTLPRGAASPLRYVSVAGSGRKVRSSVAKVAVAAEGATCPRRSLRERRAPLLGTRGTARKAFCHAGFCSRCDPVRETPGKLRRPCRAGAAWRWRREAACGARGGGCRACRRKARTMSGPPASAELPVFEKRLLVTGGAGFM